MGTDGGLRKYLATKEVSVWGIESRDAWPKCCGSPPRLRSHAEP